MGPCAGPTHTQAKIPPSEKVRIAESDLFWRSARKRYGIIGTSRRFAARTVAEGVRGHGPFR
jgi:hypothetical protein